MFIYGFPNGIPNPITIKDGGTLQNEEYFHALLNEDKILENPLYFLLKDQNGSKATQELYRKSPENVKNEIFNKIKSEIKNLSLGKFTNYFIKLIIKDNDKEKIDIIYNSLKEDIIEMSSDLCGTYVLQELIPKLDENKIEELSNIFVNKLNQCLNFVKLVLNKNFNHVLQLFIKKQQMEKNSIICDKIIEQFNTFSKNKYGCFIIEALLTNCNNESYEKIYKKTNENFNELIKDEIGNYLILFFLENKKNDEIYQNLKGNVFNFSQDKYAVNSIERAVEKGNENQRKNIIEEILNSKEKINEEDYLIYLCKHDFGNYVVQHFLKYSDETTRNNLIEKIKSGLEINSINPNDELNDVINKIIELNRKKKKLKSLSFLEINNNYFYY